jgi:hypothetical protein
MKEIGTEGGYDLDELKEAKEAFEEQHGGKGGVDTAGYVEVEPLLIQISDEIAVRQEEYEARSVIIEYDQYGEPVSVELL